MRPLVKIVWSIIAAAVTGGVLLARGTPTELSLVMTWNVFALVALVLTWTAILTLAPQQICELAQVEDPGRRASLLLVLLGAGAALLAVLLLLNASAGLHGMDRTRAIAVALVAVALAWLLIHTVFTLRYAHLYHERPAAEMPIEFPGLKDLPDYLDFAYFAFVIGMTAQTADINIHDQRVRRFALLHGVIAFVYNTAIVAMSIGLVSTLLSAS
jgi:uncharacterized membrane protein